MDGPKVVAALNAGHHGTRCRATQCDTGQGVRLFVGPVLAKHVCHVLVASYHRQVQGRHAVVALRIDLGVGIEQQLDDVGTVSFFRNRTSFRTVSGVQVTSTRIVRLPTMKAKRPQFAVRSDDPTNNISSRQRNSPSRPRRGSNSSGLMSSAQIAPTCED